MADGGEEGVEVGLGVWYCVSVKEMRVEDMYGEVV